MAEGGFPRPFEFDEEERRLVASLKFMICVASFYEDLAERLIRGAVDGFRQAGADPDTVKMIAVPGAFELPFAAKLVVEAGDCDGVVCLGAVIRGETDHYDFVCAEAARGIQQVQLEIGVPCGFGLLTCNSMEQALARSGGDKRNQGLNASLTVARMALIRGHQRAKLSQQH